MLSVAVTRKAVLISSPGPSDNYLPGVHTDVENVRQFLLSEKGGNWYESEITVLENPTTKRLERTISRAVADYTFVYYAGHGEANRLTHQSMLCVGKDLLPDTKLLNASLRQLVVVDACRVYSEPGISGLPPDFGEQFEYFEGSPARELFDRFIRRSAPGRLIVHGTQIGDMANEGNDGGDFTAALIHVSTRLKASNKLTYAPVALVLKYVTARLYRNGSHQVPCITYNDGNLQVPFAIGVPAVDLSNAKTIVLQTPNIPRFVTPRNTNNELFGWGVLGLAILLLASD